MKKVKEELWRSKTATKKLEAPLSEHEVSEDQIKSPLNFVEQKLEMKLVDMEEVKSLIVVEDEDDSACLDDSGMKEFRETHEKMLQEIKMDLQKGIVADRDLYGRIAVVESREGTEQELQEIVREAKKAAGIVEKATAQESKPKTPPRRQLVTEQKSPQGAQRAGSIVGKAIPRPDSKPPLSPTLKAIIKEKRSPFKLESNEDANEKNQLGLGLKDKMRSEEDFNKDEGKADNINKDLDVVGYRSAPGGNWNVNTPSSSDAFKYNKDGKKYRSPKTIDPFAKARNFFVRSPPKDEEILKAKETNEEKKKIESEQNRFSTQKSLNEEFEKEEQVKEEIATANEIEEEEKCFDQYEKDIQSSLTTNKKEDWDIMNMLEDGQSRPQTNSEQRKSINNINEEKSTLKPQKKDQSKDQKDLTQKLDETVDQNEIETNGDRSASGYSIVRALQGHQRKRSQNNVNSHLKEIESRINRSNRERPATSQSERSQERLRSDSLISAGNQQRRINHQDNINRNKASTPEVIELETGNYEDLVGEFINKQSNAPPVVEEENEIKVPTEKRSQAILNKLEKFLEGCLGDESDEENKSEEKGVIISSSQQIFRPRSNSRKRLSKRYSDGDEM